MSTNNNQNGLPRFDSSNVIRIDAEGPGDRTVRPCRPSLRALAEAEREKLIKYGLLKLPQPPKPEDKQGEEPV